MINYNVQVTTQTAMRASRHVKKTTSFKPDHNYLNFFFYHDLSGTIDLELAFTNMNRKIKLYDVACVDCLLCVSFFFSFLRKRKTTDVYVREKKKRRRKILSRIILRREIETLLN